MGLVREIPNFEGRNNLISWLNSPPMRSEANTLRLEQAARHLMGAVKFDDIHSDRDMLTLFVPKFRKIGLIWLNAWDTYKAALYKGLKRPPPEEEHDPAEEWDR